MIQLKFFSHTASSCLCLNLQSRSLRFFSFSSSSLLFPPTSFLPAFTPLFSFPLFLILWDWVPLCRTHNSPTPASRVHYSPSPYLPCFKLYLIQLQKTTLNPWQGLVGTQLALLGPFLIVGLEGQEEEEAMIKASIVNAGPNWRRGGNNAAPRLQPLLSGPPTSGAQSKAKDKGFSFHIPLQSGGAHTQGQSGVSQQAYPEHTLYR